MLITSTKNEIVKSVRRRGIVRRGGRAGSTLSRVNGLFLMRWRRALCRKRCLLSRDARILKRGFRHSVRSFFP